MKGSVDSYTTKSGKKLWRMRYDLPLGPDGKRRSTTKRGFTREKDANKALRDVLGQVESGTFVDPSKVTLADFLRAWLEERKPAPGGGGRGHRGKVGIGTWASYGQDLRSKVIPYIGNIPLQALTRADLNTLYDRLETSGKRAGKCATAGVTCREHDCAPGRHKGLAPKLAIKPWSSAVGSFLQL